MLTIPENADIVELSSSSFWVEESGIVCVVSKKAPPQTIEQVKASIDTFRRHIPGEKVLMLIDVTHTSERSREVRDYTAEEFSRLFKAIAMVSASPLGRMLANLFFNLRSQPYPVKMFDSEKEARAWLEKYR